MNIVKKIVNDIKYYKYRKKRDEALAKMQEHVKDEDPTLWKYWCMVYLHYLRECMITWKYPFK